jgi:hypothetical protein
LFTCETISPPPGIGEEYRDVVVNDDYRFVAPIPAGLVAWGGTPGAPFHGFTIFLNKKSDSCIHFLIGLHVDLPEDAVTTPIPVGRSKTVKVGNRTGRETLKVGIIHGVSIENVNIPVDLPRDGEKDEVTITLIGPTSEKRKTRPIFKKFISEIKFR